MSGSARPGRRPSGRQGQLSGWSAVHLRVSRRRPLQCLVGGAFLRLAPFCVSQAAIPRSDTLQPPGRARLPKREFGWDRGHSGAQITAELSFRGGSGRRILSSPDGGTHGRPPRRAASLRHRAAALSASVRISRSIHRITKRPSSFSIHSWRHFSDQRVVSSASSSYFGRPSASPAIPNEPQKSSGRTSTPWNRRVRLHCGRGTPRIISSPRPRDSMGDSACPSAQSMLCLAR